MTASQAKFPSAWEKRILGWLEEGAAGSGCRCRCDGSEEQQPHLAGKMPAHPLTH